MPSSCSQNRRRNCRPIFRPGAYGTAAIAAAIGGDTFISTWLNTESGMVHRHQSARDCRASPLAVSCHVTATPAPSCRIAVTLARRRSRSATSRVIALAIASMPPTGWNSVVW